MEYKDANKSLKRAGSVFYAKYMEAYDAAADVLLQAIDEGCIDPEVLSKASYYIMRGSHENDPDILSKLAEVADRLLSQSPDDIEALKCVRDIYFFAEPEFPERGVDKHKICQRILEIDENDVFCLQLRAVEGFTKAVNITLNEAIRLLEKAHKVDPTNLEVLNSLASKYAKAGNNQKAIENYKKVLEIMSLLPKRFHNKEVYLSDRESVEDKIRELEAY